MKTLKTIMLVEDDIDDQYFFIDALTGIENAVLYGVAGNGQEALDKLELAVLLPAMIFIDINMPIMNGIELMEKIVLLPQLSKIPVIMLTTSNMEIDRVLGMGAIAFIQKAAYGKALQQQLESVINADSRGGFNLPEQSLRTYL